MSNKTAYRYYLSELWCRAIVFVALFFFFFNLLHFVFGLSAFFDDSLNIIQIILYIFLSAGLSTGADRLINRKAESEKDVIDEEYLIKRYAQLEGIKEKTGLYVLTGESGSGKSCLLKALFEKESNSLLMDKDYYLPWDTADFFSKRYIIFDQFENALPHFDESRKRTIEELISKNCLVILSFKKEAYGSVCKLFGDKIDNDLASENRNVFWLTLNEKEKADLKKEMIHVFDRKDGQSELFDDMVKSIQNNTMTLIQFSFMLKAVIKNKEVESSDNKYQQLNGNYNLFISDYIKNTIDDYTYSDLAYQILYLLCLDEKGMYSAKLSDFRNVTLAPQDNIISTLDFLKRNRLIRLIREEQRNIYSNNYEISHDYIREVVKNICNENIQVHFRKNIEYYHSNIRLKRNEVVSDVIEETNGICEKFLNDASDSVSPSSPKRNRPINIALIFMLSAIVIVNFVLIFYYSIVPGDGHFLHFLDFFPFLNPLKNDIHAYLVLAFINLMVGLSVYYMFNYYKRFMCVFQYKPLKVMSKKRAGSKIRVDMKYGFIYAVISVMAVGFIGCVVAFLFPNYWAIGLGVEIILNGFLSFMMIRHARTSESGRFKNLGWHMVLSGVAVIGFGILFHVYAGYALWLAFPFFLLYAVFMGLCIIGHINRENMASLAGSIILNNEIVLQEGGKIQK